MPSTNTFLGEHEDFVLKLKIKGDDGKLKESEEITVVQWHVERSIESISV
jgi:hypothetical protein